MNASKVINKDLEEKGLKLLSDELLKDLVEKNGAKYELIKDNILEDIRYIAPSDEIEVKGYFKDVCDVVTSSFGDIFKESRIWLTYVKDVGLVFNIECSKALSDTVDVGVAFCFSSDTLYITLIADNKDSNLYNSIISLHKNIIDFGMKEVKFVYGLNNFILPLYY